MSGSSLNLPKKFPDLRMVFADEQTKYPALRLINPDIRKQKQDLPFQH
jgi:hypothetical protein